MDWRESPAQLDRARAEVPVTVPSPHGLLFGVYTPPSPAAPAAGRCAVLFTRPRAHRNRIWVLGARHLAARGFSAFRFDYHGSGDSEGEMSFLDPNRPYRDDADAVLRFLRERFGEHRFIVYGMCFDARTALSAFEHGAAAIDGLAFFASPVMELDTLVKARADHKGPGHLLRALGNPGNWQALGRPGRWRYMATVVGRIARRAVPGGAPRNDTPLSDGFVRHFRALVRSGARALFVYGEDDAEYVSFKVALATVFEKLTPAERARIEVDIWPGDVHGFLNMPVQRRTVERTLAWIEAFHPAGTTTAANGTPS